MPKPLFSRIFDTECERSLLSDALIISAAVALGVAMHVLGVWDLLFALVPGVGAFKIFVAGLFFTSAFTTPIAISALAGLASSSLPHEVALYGAFGAVLGDALLFLFVRDRVSSDLMCVLGTPRGRRFSAVFDRRIFKWAVPFVGALVIASPLPDELGISMMGLSRMPSVLLIPISFVMNFLGILAIALLAGAL